MKVYYIEKITGVDGWGSTEYSTISPLFDSEEKAVKWAEEHNLKLETGSYASPTLSSEEVN